jgi:hypothetical protein
LEGLYQEVQIPSAVATEWGSQLPAWITVQAVQNRPLVQALQLQLGNGEAEAIALAVETSAIRLILDDAQARQAARGFGLPVVGTLGIVLHAKQLGLVSLVRPVLDDLRATGFRLSDALLQQALQLAGE